jgi:hypothetical protein
MSMCAKRPQHRENQRISKRESRVAVPGTGHEKRAQEAQTKSLHNFQQGGGRRSNCQLRPMLLEVWGRRRRDGALYPTAAGRFPTGNRGAVKRPRLANRCIFEPNKK